ncbi:uncharacterized protein LOC131327750 [Rhododendron vialii]|uniref:uncharacterized protein LOC131327750 n=1 Tax=Rhododendron vialii TaxID=182163 RepID=UPI00265E6D1E|nr:uncharacterized protein LOC131327750 [Rhododendron vialii]
MAVQSPVSVVDFPPLGSGGRGSPNPKDSIGAAEPGAAHSGPRASVSSHMILEGKSPDPISISSSPWKNLLVNESNTDGVLELQFFPPSEEGGKLIVTPPPAIGELGAKKWQSSLVGYFLDRKVNYMTVKSIVCKIWEKFGVTDVLSNEDDFYFFLFNNDDAYKRILDSGPWHIGGHLMILKKWEPQMCLVKDQLNRIPIWVQFYNIPLEYWTAPGLSYVASAIGRPLYADSMTEKCKRLSYARVCVEIEVGAFLPSSFWLRLDNGKEVEIKAKYPWKPLQCLDCKVFGHNGIGCPKNAQPEVTYQASPQVPQQVWMPRKGKVVATVGCPNSGPKVLLQNGGQLGSPSNRFAALENFDLTSDVNLGFVEPIEVVNVISASSEPVIIQHGDQTSETLVCSNNDPSSQFVPISTAVEGLFVVPPQLVSLIVGESSQSYEDKKLVSPPNVCSSNSDVVIPLTKVNAQGTGQVAQGFGLAAEDLDEGLAPPGVRNKPKKPNKKR